MSETEKQSESGSAKAEEFAGRFLASLNDGALCLMASIGHRTGLFDVMRELSPSTVEEIAEKAGLQARYLDYALYDSITSPGRRRPGGDVGRGKSASVFSQGWFSLD